MSASRTLTTKLIHGSLLLAVTWQLLGSNLMERPRATTPGNFFYEVHEWIGLATLAIVLVFWLWTALRRRETRLGALLPWFTAVGWRAVAADARAHWASLRALKLPDPVDDTPLASAVHGLGLLTALAMGASGGLLFLQTVPGGLVLEVHKIISNLMWAYVVAHAGLAVVHQLAGHGTLRRMLARDGGTRPGP